MKNPERTQAVAEIQACIHELRMRAKNEDTDAFLQRLMLTIVAREAEAEKNPDDLFKD